MILLDTCVISEAIKPAPADEVLSWFDTLPEEQVFLPVFALAELNRGVSLLDPGRKRDALELWLVQLEDRFDGRIVQFDQNAARAWGQIQADGAKRGRPLPVQDSIIAAIALSRTAVLATRNTADFAGLGFAVINPWAGRDE